MLREVEQKQSPEAYRYLLSEYRGLDPEKHYLTAALVMRGICLCTASGGAKHISTVRDFVRVIENEIAGKWHEISDEEIRDLLKEATLFLADQARAPLAAHIFKGDETCHRCAMSDRTEKCTHYLRPEDNGGESEEETETRTLEGIPTLTPSTMNLTIGFDRKREAIAQHRQKILALFEREKQLAREIDKLSRPRNLGLGAYAETAVLGLYLLQRQKTLEMFMTEAAPAYGQLFISGRTSELKEALGEVRLTSLDLRKAFQDLTSCLLDPCTRFSPDSPFLLPSRLFHRSEMARGKTAEELLRFQRDIFKLRSAEIVDHRDPFVRCVLSTFLFNHWLNIQDLKSLSLEWVRPEEFRRKPYSNCCIVPLYNEGLFGIAGPAIKIMHSDIFELLLEFLIRQLRSGVKTNSRAVLSLVRER